MSLISILSVLLATLLHFLSANVCSALSRFSLLGTNLGNTLRLPPVSIQLADPVDTSATVYPAASFPQTVKERGGLMIEFNSNETPLSSIADVVLRCPTGESLPSVVKRIKEVKGL